MKNFTKDESKLLSFLLFKNIGKYIDTDDKLKKRVNSEIENFKGNFAFSLLLEETKSNNGDSPENFLFIKKHESKMSEKGISIFVFSSKDNEFKIITIPDKDKKMTYQDVINLYSKMINRNILDTNKDKNIYKFSDVNMHIINFLEDKEIINNFLENNNKEKLDLYFNKENPKYFNDIPEDLFENTIYYTSSFQAKEHGLTTSQYKSLVGFLITRDKNQFLSINGGPGTGKSTLLNYVVSNTLFNDFWKKISATKDNEIISFINDYQSPRMFMTGTNKNAVLNLSNLCEIKPTDKHNWIDQSDYKIFNGWDFSLVKECEGNGMKLDAATQFSYNSLKNLLNNLDHVKKIYCEKASKYFGENVDFNSIPLKLVDSIRVNVKSINDILYTLKELKEVILKFSEKKEVKNKYNNISKFQVFLNELKLNKNKSKKTIIKSFEKISSFFNDELKQYFHLVLKNSFPTKLRRAFYSNKAFFKKINKIIEKQINISKNETSEENKLDALNRIIKKWNNLKWFGEDNIFPFEEIEENDKTINKILSLSFEVDYLRIDIQKKLDTSIRHENSFLYRHIIEWKFLNSFKSNESKFINNDEMQSFKNFPYFNNINIIKPILSANIQGINFNFFKNYYYPTLKSDNNNYFDFIIMDEASQTSSSFLLPLSLLSKNVLVVGDEKQLQPIMRQNKKINSINDEVIFNAFHDKKISKDVFDQINILVKRFMFGKSALEVVNYFSPINANTSPESNDDNKYNGLFLLEHFRCPKKIFDIANNHFYDNQLIFGNDNYFESCVLSKKYGEKLTCNDTSFINISYERFINDNITKNENIKEIEIGIKFIVDNYLLFYEHSFGNPSGLSLEKILDKLKDEVAFVTFYLNQSFKIKEFIAKELEFSGIIINKEEIELWKSFFLNIKLGTIDSLQGIGCDFIIFSNVSQNFYGASRNQKRDFEFNDERTNVLWTRTKSHFIHIKSQDYWKNYENTPDQNSSFKSRVEMEVKINTLRLSLRDNNLKLGAESFESSDEMSKTGFKGEDLFSKIIDEPYLKYIFIEKMNKTLKHKITLFDKYVWNNRDNESFKNYDFHIQLDNNKLFVEIKTNKNKKENIWMSSHELELAENNKENWILVHFLGISELSNINIIDENMKNFIVNKMKVYTFNDISKLKNKNKNKYNSRFPIKLK